MKLKLSLQRAKATIFSGVALLCVFSAYGQDDASGDEESRLLTNVRQLTFEGLRAGEGYFGADGTQMIFQSERDAENPWYQIYLLDLEMGDVNRVSPGHGKTTCAWIHPDGKLVMFASTHEDPRSLGLQQEEIDFRASGQTRRYSWDYDEHFEIYETDTKGSYYKNLTNSLGYDAEGSYSPDGKLVAFASNRHAYSEPMSEEDAETFEMDKSYMMEIYVMNSDGSNLRRLTHTNGYDGGPFFSPDGQRITWRRFAPNGATAEIYTMKIDGSDQQRITRVNAMSWAPYYHPTGDYIIFTNNSLGFANFELFIVDAAGKQEPVRATFTDGFDGLPVFSPDGTKLAWTTNRTSGGKSQIFFADWNDAEARRLLKLDKTAGEEVTLKDAPAFSNTAPAIRAADMRQHIEYLASDYMEGRMTGTIGERRATQYVADIFEELGLEPAGDDGTYFQAFEFTAGVSLGDKNKIETRIDGGNSEQLPSDAWRPLAFSRVGDLEERGVVFAGYGIKAPATDDLAEYDSFVHLDVTDKWVVVYRASPLNVDDDLRMHLHNLSSLRYKAMTVRDLGAAGLIVVSGPNSKVNEQLVALGVDFTIGATSVPAISVTDAVVEGWLQSVDKDLGELQTSLDAGDMVMGFEIEGLILSGTIDIQQERKIGRNAVARLNGGDRPNDTAIVIGAHIDHLGIGRSSSSLARDDETNGIHNGADDNASGVAGVIEIAQYLADRKAKGDELSHDVIFAAWSGEELSLLGSDHFVKTYNGKEDDDPLAPDIAAYLNMDMIGRLEEKVILQGVGSSSVWPGEIERRNVPVGLSITTQNDPFIPTDATSFYLKRVPFLNAFTGAHEDYHSPRDTADKVNYEGAGKIAKFMGLVARSLAMREDAPDYIEIEQPKNMEFSGGMKVYLGTIPDYAEEIKGLKLSGVAKGGPAEVAGLKQGDVVVELGGRKVENIYDYTFALEGLRVGEETTVVVVRDGEQITLSLTPGSRE